MAGGQCVYTQVHILCLTEATSSCKRNSPIVSMHRASCNGCIFSSSLPNATRWRVRKATPIVDSVGLHVHAAITQRIQSTLTQWTPDSHYPPTPAAAGRMTPISASRLYEASMPQSTDMAVKVWSPPRHNEHRTACVTSLTVRNCIHPITRCLDRFIYVYEYLWIYDNGECMIDSGPK